jgi:hypothetical protein
MVKIVVKTGLAGRLSLAQVSFSNRFLLRTGLLKLVIFINQFEENNPHLSNSRNECKKKKDMYLY